MAGIGVRELVLLALVALALVVIWRMTSSAQKSTSRPALTPLDPGSIARIDGHVARGEKVEAIRVYRQQTGARLVDSKRAIDGWSPGTTTQDADWLD